MTTVTAVSPAAGRTPSRPTLLAHIHWGVVAAAAACAMLGIVALIAVLLQANPTPNVVKAPPVPVAVLAPAPEPPAPAKLSVPSEPPSPPPPTATPPVPVTPTVAPPPVIAPAEPPTKVGFRRRSYRFSDDLCRDLLRAPELSLDAVPTTAAQVLKVSQHAPTGESHRVPEPIRSRPDLDGLPLREGLDCQLGKESSHNLEVLSRKLRRHLTESLPKDGLDTRIDPGVLRQRLARAGDDWLQPEAVPALVQLLQAEDRRIRLLLLELLADIPDHAATLALADRALFDLAADVREEAVRLLGKRPAEAYGGRLLAGFRYPWPPVADHAAEALVALGDSGVLPNLAQLLDEPDPTAPVKRDAGLPVVREVVRVNHLRNCLLCHAPSFETTDLVRGLVPPRNQSLPPPFSPQYYHGSGSGPFVRADVTYLKQDFSVPQRVTAPGPWPAYQRYDYLVRERPARAAEVDRPRAAHATYPQRESVLFALRELTRDDVGDTSAAWKRRILQGTRRE